MRSPYDPTSEELREWAFDSEEAVPEQDWDIILSTIPYEDLFLELASDLECPKSVFFLSILYLLVGDAVRTDYRTKTKAEVETLLAKAERAYPRNWIFRWVQRSRDPMRSPETFRYDDWCAGFLAGQDEIA